MELIPLEIDFNTCCRLCLSANVKSISVFQDNIVEIIEKHLNLSVCLFMCNFPSFPTTLPHR
jgi:hypothetical protein